jgi:coenzyme F420 hydrogenase subunit beta
MKTFEDLIQEVQKPGLCRQCGGCVSFCRAAHYDALEMGPKGEPRYKDVSRCSECGLCYLVCPEVNELVEETRARLSWAEPIGSVDMVCMARARDPLIRELSTDGGTVTAMLLHLLETRRIDGAIVSRQPGPFQRLPFLARTKKDILLSAGAVYAAAPEASFRGGRCSTYVSSASSLPELEARGVARAAMVGVPDQILAMRKMETMHITPSDRIQYYFGLFCSGGFEFGPRRRARLEAMGGFSWPQVERVNLKERLQIHLTGGEQADIPLERMDFMIRPACRYCRDYSAELADISMGGLGAPEGWTTVIIRNENGKKAYFEAREAALEEMEPSKMEPLRTTALELIRHYSQAKRRRGVKRRAELEATVA